MIMLVLTSIDYLFLQIGHIFGFFLYVKYPEQSKFYIVQTLHPAKILQITLSFILFDLLFLFLFLFLA